MSVNNRVRNIVFKSVFVFLNTLFFGTSANAADAEPLKILFIGNSYTHMNEMPSILKKMVEKSGKKAIIERNTQSGASFRVHSERKDMYAAINSRKWDYVVLQGYSRELSYTPEHIDTATVPFVNKITDSIYANNPCTNVLFYMTWGYEGGFLDRVEVDTYEKMADSIERGYRYLSALYNVPVVPVGMVWKSVKQKNIMDLYAPDRAHPSINGSYLAACTFYNVIFNESNDKVYTSTVSSEFATVIKKEALSIVNQNRELYKLNNNRFNLKPFITDKGVYSLNFSSYFPLALSVKWSFGDGKQSSALKGTHVYGNPGKYIVRIEIQEECGLKVQERVVIFNKPAAPEELKKQKPKYNVNNKKKI